jgi:hypothetical protein
MEKTRKRKESATGTAAEKMHSSERPNNKPNKKRHKIRQQTQKEKK